MEDGAGNTAAVAAQQECDAAADDESFRWKARLHCSRAEDIFDNVSRPVGAAAPCDEVVAIVLPHRGDRAAISET